MATSVMKKAEKLIADCKRNLAGNEYNSRRFKKVSNCSHSDIETVLLYAETVSNHGSYTGTLMQPRGNVAAVLLNCGLYETEGGKLTNAKDICYRS